MTNVEHVYQVHSIVRFPPTELWAVSEVEKLTRVTFPDDYREYLLRFNGGYFNEPSIELPDATFPDDALDCMYGIGAVDPSAELGNESDLRIWSGNDPPILYPIGYTVLGFLVVLVTDLDEDYGCVYLRTFESAVFKTATEMHYLADGIDQFFGLLQESLSDEVQ